MAEGESGKEYRYLVRRSTEPITAENFDPAELVGRDIFNNSAARFGYAFGEAKRTAADVPMAIIAEGGEPLPRWSGLAVHTATKDARAYYAVVVTDLEGKPVTQPAAGDSATTSPVEEKVAPLSPLKLGDGKDRGRYANLTSVTGTKKLPLNVQLHASQGQGGGPNDHGDLYYYFATQEMGYREGLPGYFTVHERRYPEGNQLHLQSRDAIERPDGKGLGARETYWFGYYCVPQWVDHEEPRAYPFTERRMLWIIDWTIKSCSLQQCHREVVLAAKSWNLLHTTASRGFQTPSKDVTRWRLLVLFLRIVVRLKKEVHPSVLVVRVPSIVRRHAKGAKQFSRLE